MPDAEQDEWRSRRRRQRRWLKRLVAFSAFLAVGSWLFLIAQWPESCIYVAEEVAYIVHQFACSTDLLRGGMPEKMLFVWLWTIPVLLVGAGLLRLVDELRRRMQQ